MKILAVEFSSSQRSVAVVSAGAISEVIESAIGAPTTASARSDNVYKAIEEVLQNTGLEREQIECLAVGIGPGSYSGIRGAIALAQGWQLARGVKIIGISSAECIATQAADEGIRGVVNVVIDAQRGEFYLARYELGAAGCAPVDSLRLATLPEVQERERVGELLIGPEVTRWFPSGKVVFPRAATLGRLASTRNDFIAGEKLEPIYLRETNFVKAPPPRVIL